jgi:HD-GYP domain-containing protein (c-di-GMP phosphodiesterase class II)/DNA-binding CsgD family transcriptional regulator
VGATEVIAAHGPLVIAAVSVTAASVVKMPFVGRTRRRRGGSLAYGSGMSRDSRAGPIEQSSGARLSEVIAAVSLAADLGLGQPMEHVLRSCVIATRFARHLGVSDEDLESTYWLTLLVTVGCTGASYELTPLFGDDIAWRSRWHDIGPSALSQLRYHLGRAGNDKSSAGRLRVRADLVRTGLRAVEDSLVAHCRVSTRLGVRVGLDPRILGALGQTFARWDGKGLPRGLGGDQIGLAMQIAQMADGIEVWHREDGVPGAVARVLAGAGTFFDPDLVASWAEAAVGVLDSLSEESSWDVVIAAEPRPRPPLTQQELDAALEVVADYADLKSPWFSGHSHGVADLVARAARHAGVSEADVTTVRRAALLHDLGRNGVPNSIWDKPGPLTEPEWERVRLHPYYTDRVVRRAGSLAHLAPIASAAHERADGSGYPRGIAGDTIPRLGSILGAADAYHAMLEPRPFRPPLSKQAAARALRDMARAGTLRGDAVDWVLTAAGHPPRRKPTALAGLTPREVQVLTRVARGATLRDTGEQLGITAKTAGNHVERIYIKIGASSRAEATMFAMQHGLLDSI